MTTTYGVCQDLYWTNFENSIVVNNSLISVHTDYPGKAKSQINLKKGTKWELDYIVNLDEASKTFGLIRSEDEVDLSTMDFGVHISTIEEGVVYLFVYGELVYEFSVDNNDDLKVIYEDDDLIKIKNGEEEVFSYSFIVEEDYVVGGIIGVGGSLDRLNYNTDYQEVVSVEFDTLTHKGTISIELPEDAPEGPYHYLLSKSGFVDFNQIKNDMEEEIEQDLDPSTNSSKTYSFDNLNPDTYYLTVLDSEGVEVINEKVNVNGNLLNSSFSKFTKEGNVVFSNDDLARLDLPIILKEDSTEVNIVLELHDVESEQYYGLGDTDDLNDSKNAVIYGFYVSGQNLYQISNGIQWSNPVSINDNDKIGFNFIDGNVFISVDGEDVFTDVLSSTNYVNGLNFKMGLNKTLTSFKPLIVKYKLKPFYSLIVDTELIECDEAKTSAQINFFISDLSHYSFASKSFSVKDENGNIVGWYSTNASTTINNLPPGRYFLEGVLHYYSVYSNVLPVALRFSKEFLIGYPVSWFYKANVLENLADLSVVLDNPVGSQGSSYGKAASNNTLTSSVNWVDFKLKDKPASNHSLVWTEQPFSSNISQNEIVNLMHTSFDELLIYNTSIISVSPFNKNDRYRIEYDFNSIKFYHNYGSPIFTVSNTPTNYKRVNLWLSNFTSGGTGLYDVKTNMPCIDPLPISVKLARKLDGTFYNTVKQKLYVEYEEPYEVDSKTDISYEILDQSNFVVSNGDALQNVTLHREVNTLIFDFTSKGNCLNTGFYTLRVYGPNGDRRTLRFYHDNTGC